MRIIAGKYKHSSLQTLEGDNTRPTRDMVKEAVFSAVDFSSKRVLDLFSGSGAIGLEALSRGAEDAVFNDSSFAAVKIIKANLTKFAERRSVYNLDYADCLNKLRGQRFDIVFLDPPYILTDFSRIFELLISNELLNEDAMVIIETAKKTPLPLEYGDIKFLKAKNYGISKISYYKRKEL